METETFTKATVGAKRRSARIRTAISIAAMAGGEHRLACTATARSTPVMAGERHKLGVTGMGISMLDTVGGKL